MNEINVRNEILESIDNTEKVTMESSIDVLMSMSAAYDKAVSIMEFSTADDLSMFSIFQEAEVAAGDAKTNAGAKDESIGYKILMFIPRLLKAFWEFIKKVWNNNIVPSAEQATKTVKSIPEAIREKIDSLLGKDEGSLKTILAGLGFAGAALAGATAAVMAATKKNEGFKTRVSTFVGNAKNFFKVLKDSDATPVWRISLKNMTITTNLSLETIKDLSATKFLNVFKEVAALPPTLSDYTSHVEKITNAVNDIRALPIMLPEPEEYTFDEVAHYLASTEKGIAEVEPVIKQATANIDKLIAGFKLSGYDKDSAGDNPHAKEMQYIANLNSKKTEALSSINKIKDQLTELCNCSGKVISFTANIGKEYNEYIAIAKKAADELSAEANGGYGISVDGEKYGTEEPEDAATDEMDTDVTEKDIKAGTDYPAVDATTDPTEVGESAKDNVSEGEETVQESAEETIQESVVEELTEADIEINNHWYR
jgi:hypothetical protein